MKKILKRIWLPALIYWVGVFMLPQQAHGQSDSAFTLQAAIDYALAQNINVKNAKLEQRIADAKVKETRGIGLPQVSASATLINNVKIQRAIVPASTFDPTAPSDATIALEFGVPFSSDFSLSASQLLFNGSYLVGLKAAATYRELTQKQAIQTQVEVVAAVSKAFYGVLVNDYRLQVIDINLSRLDSLRQQTQKLYQAGFVEKLDVSRIQVTINNLQTEKQNLEQLVKLSRQLLKFQMGYPVNEPIALQGNLDQLKPQPVLTTAEPNFNQRIEYSMLATQEQLNELDLKNIRASGLPVLAAFGNYGANNGRQQFGQIFSEQWFDYAAIGLSLNWNIFDGTQRIYKAQQAKISLMKTQNSRELLKQSIVLEQNQTATTLNNALRSLDNQQRNMKLAEEVYQSARKKYEAGVGTSYEVTDAEASFKEARNNYFTALYDALVAQVDYQKANGQLQTQTIK